MRTSEVKLIHLISAISKRYGLQFLKFFVGIGLVLYLVQKISIKEIFISLKSINLIYFSIAVVLAFLNVFIQFIRWKTLLRNEFSNLNESSIFKSLLIGFSAGTFTPARSGEYFLRKLPLKELNLSSVITLTFIDKMMLLLNVIFWGSLVSFGMMIFYYQVDYFVSASLFIIFISFFTALFLTIYSKRFYNYLREIKQRFNIKFQFLKKLIEPLSDLNNQLVSKLVLLGFLNLLIIVVEFVFIILSFDSQLHFGNLVVAAMMVYFSKTLIPSITLGEIGIRESAAIYFFGLFGASESIAFNSSMMLFFLNLLLPSLIGLYFLLRFKREL